MIRIKTLPSLTAAEEHAARLALSQLGCATLLAGTQHPSLLSGSDQVVAGSSVPVHAVPVPGGHGAGFPVGPGHIAQAGPTAAGIKAGQHPPTAAPGVTLPDKTKVNLSGVQPVNIPKHHG